MILRTWRMLNKNYLKCMPKWWEVTAMVWLISDLVAETEHLSLSSIATLICDREIWHLDSSFRFSFAWLSLLERCNRQSGTASNPVHFSLSPISCIVLRLEKSHRESTTPQLSRAHWNTLRLPIEPFRIFLWSAKSIDWFTWTSICIIFHPLPTHTSAKWFWVIERVGEKVKTTTRWSNKRGR